MNISRSNALDSPRGGVGLAALLLATFTVSASFGLVLPIAPELVRAATPGAPDVALHAGGLTAIYMLAVAAFAPFWGHLSDRRGRRPVLVIGLVGFAFSMGAFSIVRSLPQLYVERLMSGLFAAAISPVAAAFVADTAPSDQWRASRMAWLNMASILGFILGPSLSVWTTKLGSPMGRMPALAEVVPFFGAAALALLAAGWLAIALSDRVKMRPVPDLPRNRVERPLAGVLLGLTFVTAAIVGVFEVGVSLRSGRLAGATSSDVAAMFAVCSLVMFVTQAVLFSPLVRAERTWRLLAPGFGLLTVGLLLASGVGGFAAEMAVVGLVAASAGAVSPTIAYWLSVHAGRRQGSQLGRQAAAASLGQAAGSAAGGWLLSHVRFGDPFMWSAALAAASAIVALRIASRLPPSAEADPRGALRRPAPREAA